MSTFYYGGHQQHQAQNPHPMPQSHSHHGRSRRAPRISSAQNSQRQYRVPKMAKEAVLTEAPTLTAYRQRFEAGRSFDLDDDLEFCPNLLSYDESQIQPQQITPSLSISSAATSAYVSPPTFMSNNNNLKIHQPSALRSRTNAIPIVNPSTGTRIASPPSSISPGMMQQATAARRW
ncbi:hypothetical protein LTR79_009889 [Exophiala xenobiotica]|nr:hypothetical protein LTR79_009889 [Exophiala xenobiotica]